MAAITDAQWKSFTPKEARELFRSGEHVGKLTSGMCSGHLQANLTIVHQSLANDFEKFCVYNSLPLLYRSKVGEVGCPPLAADSDVRTDLALYCVFKEGELVDKPSDLLQFDWSERVTFYLGCSFGFEKALLDHGVPVRNIEQKRNVSVYVTNIPCKTSGSISANLVVSMRPIPRDALPLAVSAARSVPRAHGSPMHIGDPTLIGIRDLGKPDLGNVLEFVDGDVPVFWTCGLLGRVAITATKPDLFLCHSPGSMFVCDALSKSPGLVKPDIAVVPINQSSSPFAASLVSENAARLVSAIERSLGGAEEGFLLKASLSLNHSSRVLIAVGSSGCVLGLCAVLKSLRALQKKVSVHLDKKDEATESAIEKFFDNVPVSSDITSDVVFDHVLSIGDVSPALLKQFSDRKIKIAATSREKTKHADFSVQCGNLNVGGFGLAAALRVLTRCPVHVHYLIKGVQRDVPVEEDVLMTPEETKEIVASAVGVDFGSEKIDEIRKICLECE